MIRIILSLLLICGWQICYACNGCGCSVNGSGLGLIGINQQNYITALWNRTCYSTVASHNNDIQDQFNTWDLSVRYNLNTKFSVVASQAIKYNIRFHEENSSSVLGLGDTRLTSRYLLVDKLDEETRLTWDFGLGIQLPLGNFDDDIHERDLPFNFNPGTGNFAGIALTNFAFVQGSWGFGTSLNYVYNGPSRSGYKYGNTVQFQSNAFYTATLKRNFKLVPAFGIQGEYISKDSYRNGKKIDETGGQGLFASLSLGIQKDSWQLIAEALLPITGSYVNNEMNANVRSNVQLVYFF